MNYRYYLCDVFTDQRFGGNQLAVLPDASGLTDEQMQSITREFNFSETSFVFPAERGHTRQVRIFTPARELPFAGHPNLGTAFVLAQTGALGPIEAETTVIFEEKAGLVPIDLRAENGKITFCELRAPQAFELGKTISIESAAAALSLRPIDIATENHPPQIASVGMPFVMVELRERAALERARVNLSGFEAIQAQDVIPDIYFYLRSKDDFDIRARMFGPLTGVPEDPATGSANCALAGLLAQLGRAQAVGFAWRVAQGVEMGRPSSLFIRAEKKNGRIANTWVGGSAVMVSEGVLYLD